MAWGLLGKHTPNGRCAILELSKILRTMHPGPPEQHDLLRGNVSRAQHTCHLGRLRPEQELIGRYTDLLTQSGECLRRR
jgi:hypothetical protein